MTKFAVQNILFHTMEYLPLKNYLNSLAPLSEAEWDDFAAILYQKKFKRTEIFQAEERVCDTVGFILEGCFRSVKYVNGEERTFSFAIENEFVTNYYSILTRTKSEVSIVAVEPSVVVCADAAKMLSLFDSSPTWQRIGRRLAEQAVCFYSERLMSAFYDTPKIRFDKMMAASPELFLRVPHHMLANYLGMTKETLSRLRNPYK